MEHSTTTELWIDVRDWFTCGVNDFNLGDSLEEALDWVEVIKTTDYGDLAAMAYYDGYIRRKHGLVDENGEEIFR